MTTCAGTKIPLVLLPGMLCDWAYWHAQQEALEDICDVLIPNYGELDSITAMAEHVLARAAARFVVCGHSMGGRIVLEIYRLAPERVLGLGLFGTAYRAPDSNEERERELQQLSAQADRAEALGMRAFGHEWALRLLPAERRGDDVLVAAITEMVARQSPAIIRAQSHAGATRREYRDLLPRIRRPALICAGALDVLRSIGPHQEMAAAIPNARLVVIPAAGHMMSMERPCETSAEIRSWLNETMPW
jgi:pimeloyl-ACP methyl ester carboxylesterase